MSTSSEILSYAQMRAHWEAKGYTYLDVPDSVFGVWCDVLVSADKSYAYLVDKPSSSTRRVMLKRLALPGFLNMRGPCAPQAAVEKFLRGD